MSGSAGAGGSIEYAELGLQETLTISIDAAPDGPGSDPSDAPRRYFEEANKPYQWVVAEVLKGLEPVLQDAAARLKLIPVEVSEVSQRTVLRPATGEDNLVEAIFVVASSQPLTDEDTAWLQGQVESRLKATLPERHSLRTHEDPWQSLLEPLGRR